VWNNCSGSPRLPCTLNVTTVSQPMYSRLEGVVGAGFTHSTAYEIRIKMKSRQVGGVGGGVGAVTRCLLQEAGIAAGAAAPPHPGS
jgi:hypothetical protein